MKNISSICRRECLLETEYLLDLRSNKQPKWQGPPAVMYLRVRADGRDNVIGPARPLYTGLKPLPGRELLIKVGVIPSLPYATLYSVDFPSEMDPERPELTVCLWFNPTAQDVARCKGCVSCKSPTD